MATTIMPGARRTISAPPGARIVSAGAPRPGTSTAPAMDELIRKFVNAQPWTYYDTYLISAYTAKGNTAAVNFAGLQTPITFFNRQKNKHGLPVTNMASDKSEFDQNFICAAIALDVFCPSDIGGTSPTATQFVELLVQNSVFTIEMGDDLILAKPAIELPSGGGIYTGARVVTQAAAADSARADANNGFPAADGLMYLSERILFEKNQAFSANLVIGTGSGTAGPLTALQALTALSGNQTAGIRVRMIGVRGEKLLKGTPRAGTAATR